MSIADDLEIARDLARMGVPIFLAQPDPSSKTGYTPPGRWQTAVADPSVVDAWRPGMALCAVMGHVFDLVDVDPRNAGSGDPWGIPNVYGEARTPSGGVHYFIRPLGVESRDGAVPGMDIKAGTPEGVGRGFAFIAPTVRRSKVDGQERAYRWTDVPRVPDSADDSGAPLRAHILRLRERSPEGAPRRLPRSAARAEWDRAVTRLTADLEHWKTHGWGGAAHAGLLAHSTHLARLSPDHAADAYLQAFTAAGLEPDEADLVKLTSALDTAVPDVVVPDEDCSPQDLFWAGVAMETPPEAPKAEAPPGAFDFVDPARARARRPAPQGRYGRFGGQVGLFYPQGVHWLQGESESGKSWVLLCHTLDVLRDGRPVLMADYEDHEDAVLERLVQLGATDPELGRLVYVPAIDVPYEALKSHVVDQVGRNYGLLAIDGVTAALSSAGLSGRDEQELTRWADELPRRAEASQVVDHVVKAVDDRRGMAIGTQAKKSVVTGTAFEVVCTEKFGRGGSGVIDLMLQKDKRGGVRSRARERTRLRFTSDPTDGAVTIAVAGATTPAAVARIESGRAAQVLALAERIHAAEIAPSTTRGASTKAREGLVERSGESFDKNLWGDAWRTHLARSGVPEATIPEYVREHLQTATSLLFDNGYRLEDHQAVSGDSGEVPSNGVHTPFDVPVSGVS